VWLYANNRVDEAERVIRHAAKLNGIVMPDNILASRSLEIVVTPAKPVSTASKSSALNGIKGDFGPVLSSLDRFKRAKEKAVSIQTRYTLLDVFRNFRLAMYTVCMSFLWSVELLYSLSDDQCLVSDEIRLSVNGSLRFYGFLVLLLCTGSLCSFLINILFYICMNTFCD